MTTETKRVLTATQSRDLTADIAICDAATAGPWKYVDNSVELGDPERLRFIFAAEDDARFIAESRTGWPHAIRRAIDAEERIRELCDRNAYYIDAASRAEDQVFEYEAALKAAEGAIIGKDAELGWLIAEVERLKDRKRAAERNADRQVGDLLRANDAMRVEVDRLRTVLTDISERGYNDNNGGSYSYSAANHAECVRLAKKAL